MIYINLCESYYVRLKYGLSFSCSLKNSVIALGEDLGEPVEKESEFKKLESNDENGMSKILQEFVSISVVLLLLCIITLKK